ncbi:glycine betaine ABC transporter substrate-binding protein [Desulfobulbus rhabdoformis]|jgi:glycine betaine/proline transport system substrate-binding protein|uniref:glycine betaine ABC transporter substrate-binding protein n=1 Tax=Desulfobulbus rhabdoformis TaxID=34032 RepID=UPI00196573A0|nr:glycine betaine ABC transporter substrate-binding protein [Desulfobulbus rhabdoformis]MBM9616797.1 glycine betaine ABC transporter substrate-binding protein [Desulfobulbus rhabdoformis]
MKRLLKICTVLVAVSCMLASPVFAKKTARIAYVEWARAVAITHVAGEILKKEGYKVKLQSVATAAMWASVATGDSDALLCAWLPVTHADLYAEYKDKVVDLGPNYTGAKLGLVAPAYVGINSIAEMKDHLKEFDGKIIGIDPGAGMSKSIEKAIAENTSGLGKFKYISGSDAIMVASLAQAIKNKEWIVVPGWQPHWMFGQWKLKILDDPDGIFGSEETINTVVRGGLEKEDPELFAFFKKIDWKQLPMDTVLLDNKKGMDPRKSAKKYVEANWDKIEAMLKK